MVDSHLGNLWNPERQAMSGVFILANLAGQLIAATQSGRPMLQAYSSLEEWLWISGWSMVGALGGWALTDAHPQKKAPMGENGLADFGHFRHLGGRDHIGQAEQVARQIQPTLTFPFSLNQQEIFINASVGLVLGTAAYKKPEHLLRDGDAPIF